MGVRILKRSKVVIIYLMVYDRGNTDNWKGRGGRSDDTKHDFTTLASILTLLYFLSLLLCTTHLLTTSTTILLTTLTFGGVTYRTVLESTWTRHRTPGLQYEIDLDSKIEVLVSLCR